MILVAVVAVLAAAAVLYSMGGGPESPIPSTVASPNTVKPIGAATMTPVSTPTATETATEAEEGGATTTVKETTTQAEETERVLKEGSRRTNQRVFGLIVAKEDPDNATLYEFDLVERSVRRILNESPIYSFDFDEEGNLYIAADYSILKIDGGGRVSEVADLKGSELSPHYLRLGPGGDIYFSIPDRGIYRLNGDRPVRIFDVDQDFVDDHLLGYWDGQFALDGEGNIYLSTGWSLESAVIRITEHGEVKPLVRRMKLPTGGLRFVDELSLKLSDGTRVDLSGTLMFSDGEEKIYFLDFSGEKPVLHYLELPPVGYSFIWDVGLGPSGS